MAEYVEITIDENGTIEAKIHGIKGPSCEGFADWLKSLGEIEQSSRTPDYFAAPGRVQRTALTR